MVLGGDGQVGAGSHHLRFRGHGNRRDGITVLPRKACREKDFAGGTGLPVTAIFGGKAGEKTDFPPRPAHPGPQDPNATDRHLQGAIRGHTAELEAIYPAGRMPATASRAAPQGPRAVAGPMGWFRPADHPGRPPAVRATPAGSSPDRPGRSGRDPRGGDRRRGRHWPVQWSRRGFLRPRRRRACVSRALACAARQRR
jgi:hypothetical protein